MAITEKSRHEMITALERTIGKEAAMTLAEHLPPVGWADVATRHDLDAMRTEINLRFDALDHRFEALDHRFEALDHRFEALDHRFVSLEQGLRAELHSALATSQRELTLHMSTQTRHMVVATIGSVATFAGVVVGALFAIT